MSCANTAVGGLTRSDQFNYAGQLLSIGALLFSRLSVSALIEALRPGQAVILANRICAVLILCWGITSFFALAFQCSLPNPWLFNPRNTCIHRFALYASLDAIAMITDLTLIVVPVFVMRKVQVPLTKRATVILLFALRAVVIAATILKLKYSNQYFSNISVEAGGLTSAGRVENDATWGLLVPIVWRQAAMNLSVVSACLPSLKRILSDMRPGLNGVTIPHALELSLSNAFGQNGVRANLDSRNRSVQLEPGSSPSDSGSNGLKLSSGRRVSRGFPFGISSGGKNTTSVSTGSVAALREKDPFGIFLDLDSESMRQLREEGIVQKKDITVEIETMERRGSSSLSGGESEKTLVRETITSRLM